MDNTEQEKNVNCEYRLVFSGRRGVALVTWGAPDAIRGPSGRTGQVSGSVQSWPFGLRSAGPRKHVQSALLAGYALPFYMSISAVLHYLLLTTLEAGVLGLRIVSLDVPQRVSVGREVLLKCAYDLEGDLLYSVKWYKDDIEFFRYVPSDRPPGQYFEVNGIRVDVSLSEKLLGLLEL